MRSAATVASQSQSSKLITSAQKCFKLACRGCGAWENSHKELEPLQITMFKLTWLSYQIIELSNLLSSFLQELFIGHTIQDQEPAIIHYFDFSWFSFPDFAAGWALSVPLLNRQVRVKVFFFFFKKTNKTVFLPRFKFCGNLLKQKFPSFSLVTRTLFSTKVYQRHIRQNLRSGTTKRIIFTEYLFERSWLRSVQTWQACPRKGLSWNEEMFTRSVYTR